ncbi:uncharacterized protein LOC114018411 [Chelonia mydas]|uniref:uncharacterized protein LOC114018411 n=1 Tax=Chelonia mydas TaxID=8469 RepID=UPI0018A219BB|nr:uncharacterized protein LOC114018411 [Chelonia mydas]
MKHFANIAGGAIRNGNWDKRCRKCGYANETLLHVLCGCKQHSGAWRHCHNAIQNQLVKAIPLSLGKITVDSAIPGTDSRLRPNIIVTDTEKKKVLMVDVTVPFKNRSQAFHKARAQKALKYTSLADTLRAQGYDVQIHTLSGRPGCMGPPQ